MIHRMQGVAAVMAARRDLDVVTARRVEVRAGRMAFDGRTLGVDAEGHLRVKETRGRGRTVMTGDIRLLE